MHKTMLTAAIAAATLGFGSTAKAEQIHWPWQQQQQHQQRPVQRHVPTVKRAIPADAMATTRTMEPSSTDSYSSTSEPYQSSAQYSPTPGASQFYQPPQADSYPSTRSSAPEPFPAIKVSPPTITSSRTYSASSNKPTQEIIPQAAAQSQAFAGPAVTAPHAPVAAAPVVTAPQAATAAIVPVPASASDAAFTAPQETAANAHASAAPPSPAPQPVLPQALAPAPVVAAAAAPQLAPPPAQESAPQLAAVTSNAAPLRAAALCMNEQKANAVDDTVKACDAVIDETQKSLANAYYFRASAKFDKKDFDGAIGDYGLAIKLYPNDPDYLNSRGAAFEAKNDLDHALADYNAVIKADPKAVYGYNSRGAAYQRKGDFARAAADYGEVTRLQPDNIDAWSARCWVRAITPGQTQLALGDCNAALKLKPYAGDVLDTRGFVYLKLGQTDSAITDYDAALKLDPKLAGSLYGRGIAKMHKGDKNGGAADMASAKALRANIADEFARYGVKP